MTSEQHIKHLLLLTPGFPANESDTTCLPAVQQFVLCYQKKYPDTRLTVITLHYPFDKHAYTWHGIPAYSMQGQNKHGIKRLITVFKTIAKGRSLNRKNKFNAILSFWLTDAALAGKYISKLTRAPHFIWMHGQDARAGNKYVKYVDAAPTQLAAISEYQNDILQKEHYITAKYIVHNGINKAIFPAFNNGQRDIDILAVGSLIPLKRYHLLVGLIKDLVDEGYTKLRVILAGAGVSEPALREQIKALGIEQHINLIGSITHPDVLRLMNTARLFVHTSEYEGHSTVLLEALYSGCKTLSFIPVANEPVANFTLCTDAMDMKIQCSQLLSQSLTHQQVLYSDMEDSATQIHDILASML